MTSFRPRIPGTTACDRLRHPRGYGAGQSGGTMQHTKTRNVSDALPQTDFFSTMASIHQVALLDALPPPTYLPRIFQGKAGKRGEEGETQCAAIQALPCCYLRRALASLPPYLPFHLVAGAGTLSNQPFELQVENWVAKGNNCDSGVVL